MKYVTVDEFKNAPTGIDTSEIIPGATQAENDAELANILERACGWVNTITDQETLIATSDTDYQEVRLSRDGTIIVFPDAKPIISLSSLSYRILPANSWTDIALTNVQTYNDHFIIYNLNALGVSPLLADQFATLRYYSPQDMDRLHNVRITLKYTYINGYPHTELSSSVLQGATELPIVDATGVEAGKRLTIYDDGNTETVTVDSVSGNTVTTTSGTSYAHDAGVQVSAIPAEVKQATILLAAYLIKERGSLSVVMNETSLQGIGRYIDAADIKTAERLLQRYKRVR